MARKKTRSFKKYRMSLDDQDSDLLPNLTTLVEEIQQAQEKFSQLYAQKQELSEQVEQQDRTLVETKAEMEALRNELSQLQQKLNDGNQRLGEMEQREEDLTAHNQSLKQKLEQAEAEIADSQTAALVSLFEDMAGEHQNRLLRKLLTFQEEDPQELLQQLATYLRERVQLNLEGEVGAQITLTEENLDQYEVQERVILPSQAEIIGRGISLKDRSILRTEVALVEENTEDGI